MSTRSRAKPWFLDRPADLQWKAGPHEIDLGHGALCDWREQWSFDGRTWFWPGGDVARVGTDEDYGFPTRRWREREDAAALARRTVIADLLGTSFISVVS